MLLYQLASEPSKGPTPWSQRGYVCMAAGATHTMQMPEP